MRGIAALALFVCSTGAALVAGTADAPASWKDLHAGALAAADAKDYPTAIALLKRCEAAARTPEQTAETFDDRGVLLFRSGQFKEAREALLLAIGEWRKQPENLDRKSQALITLGRLDRRTGDYDEAEKSLREALAPAPPDVETRTRGLAELGDMMREQGQNAEARELLRQTLDTPGITWQTRADATLGLAELNRDEQLWNESIAQFNEIGEIGRAHNAKSLEAIATRGLGQVWLDRGDPDRAEPLLKNALAAFETQPDTDRQIGATLTCLAQLHLRENKPAIAEEELTRALALNERSFGEMHPQAAMVHQLLADALARRGEMDLAREHMTRAVEIFTARFGENSAMVAAMLASWGAIEERGHDAERAAGIFEKSLAALEAGRGPQADRVKLFVLRHYAAVLESAHRKRQANAVRAELKSFQAR